MKCGIYDSKLTAQGKERKRIYVANCGGNFGHEAQHQAREDFMLQKTPINNIERIKPFKRRLKMNSSWVLSKYESEREIQLERQEYADAAFYYMRYIL